MECQHLELVVENALEMGMALENSDADADDAVVVAVGVAGRLLPIALD